MNKDTGPMRPYNSRIIASFVGLIKRRYPHVDLEELLEYAEMEPYQVDDQAYWFTQEEVDRFYDKLVQLTGNKEIAREAGRNVSVDQEGNLMRRYFLTLLGPAGAYSAVSKASVNFTKFTHYQAKKLSQNSMEITFTVDPEIKEQPYQCENRMGMLESIALIFYHKPPHINHSECLFHGGSCCRYIITWDNSPSAILNKIRYLLISVMAAVNAGGFLTVPEMTLKFITPLSALVALGFTLFTKDRELREIRSHMGSLQTTTDELVRQIDLNYNNTRIAQEISQEINKKSSQDEILERVIHIIERRLNFDRGLILLANPEGTRLAYQEGFGYLSEYLEILKGNAFHLDKEDSRGCFVVCYKEKRPFLVNNVDEIKKDLTPRSLDFARRLGSKAFICVPIVCDNQALGILTVDNLHSQRPLMQTDISLLMSIASVTAIGLKNARLLQNREDQFQSILQVLASSIDARDPLTAGHSEKVTEYAEAICRELSLSREYKEMIRIAALLHDYGKIGVPDSILKKQGPLTEEEFRIIQTHVVKTREILEQIQFEGLHSYIPGIASSHHERMDGTGYPKGLMGEEIPLGARILAVADFFEAITSQRHYRNPMSFKNAVKVLRREKGDHLDPRIVEVFIRYLEKAYGTSFAPAPEVPGKEPVLATKLPEPVEEEFTEVLNQILKPLA